MDFRHLIVTCLFSMLRLSFEAQKIKENYAIFSIKRGCVVIECYDAAFVFSALSFFLSLSRRILLIFP